MGFYGFSMRFYGFNSHEMSQKKTVGYRPILAVMRGLAGSRHRLMVYLILVPVHQDPYADGAERQTMKQEKTFFETMAGALSPGWTALVRLHTRPNCPVSDASARRC